MSQQNALVDRLKEKAGLVSAVVCNVSSMDEALAYVADTGKVQKCDLCGGEIYQGQAYYRINGRTVCRDCLADYAESYFADCLCGEEAAPW